MIWLLKFIGPTGVLIAGAALLLAGWWGVKEGQVWLAERDARIAQAEAAKCTVELDALRAQVAALGRERDAAQGRANAAGSRYRKLLTQRERDRETILDEYESVRVGEPECVLPDGLQRLWDKANAGRLENTGGRRPADPLPSPAPTGGLWWRPGEEPSGDGVPVPPML